MERNTPQRNAIREAFSATERPLTPKEVLDSARRRIGTLGLATVYRTLKSLTEEGWLEAVELPGEPQRYERAGKEHHHHFNCNRCGRTFEMEGCPRGFEEMVPQGFTMEAHEVFIYGSCAECGKV